MKFRILCLSLALTSSAICSRAQEIAPFGLPPSRANRTDRLLNSLSGTVRTSSGQPVRNARIEIRSLGAVQAIASGYTQPGGRFEFANLPRGTYEVIATAGVDQATQRVDVFQGDAEVQLTMFTANSSAADSTAGGRATISVAQLKIPDRARKLYDKAQEAFLKEKLADAREQLQKSLTVFPDYAQALTLRGVLNLQDSKLDAACADLEHAIKADYSYGMAYTVLGAAYNLMRRYDDSIRTVERGVSLNPGMWQGYYELSKALLGKGQFEAALRQINRAAELGPQKYPAIHMVRAHALLGLKDYQQAVAELEQVIVADPSGADSAQARQTLGQVKAFMASKTK